MYDMQKMLKFLVYVKGLFSISCKTVILFKNHCCMCVWEIQHERGVLRDSYGMR